MVQFLNAFYRKENTDARRLRALTDAVILFDEVQALPKKCTVLFERAVRFLASYCGCTALIMTATQPQLDLPGRDLVADVPKLFRDLRRVEYVDESRRARDDDQAAEGLFRSLTPTARCWRWSTPRPRPNPSTPGAPGRGRRRDLRHLSTFMCPEHRRAVLRDVKARLDGGQRVFLVSTALIEAGVNISFPRWCALWRPAQHHSGGGRCNRNGRRTAARSTSGGFAGESLSRLWEVRMGQKISDEILDHLAAAPPIWAARILWIITLKRSGGLQTGPPLPLRARRVGVHPGRHAVAEQCVPRAAGKKQNPLEWLYLARASAPRAGPFTQSTGHHRHSRALRRGARRSSLNLAGRHGMKDEILLMRRAQRFSVSVFRQTFQKLEALGALAAVGETGAMALKKAFYDQTTGLRLEPGALEFLYN
jgi:CRISPR-associated endonuclease/helicase Cas3